MLTGEDAHPLAEDTRESMRYQDTGNFPPVI